MSLHRALVLPAPDAPPGATAHHRALADLLRAAVALEVDPAGWSGPLASPQAAPVGARDDLEVEALTERHGEAAGWLTVAALSVARDVGRLAGRQALPSHADRWRLLDGLAVAAEGVCRA